MPCIPDPPCEAVSVCIDASAAVNPRRPAESLVISCAFSMRLSGEGGIEMVLDCGHALGSLGSFGGGVVSQYQAWWYTPVIPALKRLRQEGYKLQVSLG